MKRSIIICFVAMWAIAGCGESDPLQAQLNSWKEAGLETTPFTDAKAAGLNAISCYSGKVSGIHVTLCDYADEAASQQATQAGRKSIGNTTGVALAKGQVLLVASDRDKVDPNGRTINTITQAFWGKKD